MLKRKRIRTRGKAQLSKYFKEFKQGDKVAIIQNLSHTFPYPRRLQGLSGKVVGKRGEAYVISIKDGNKQKTIILKAVHLKKLKELSLKEK